jgi:hypothetical protein
MTKTHSSIATDSAALLHQVIGSDATATFEGDPKFVASNPGADATSENSLLLRDTDDVADSEEELEEIETDPLDDEDGEDESEDVDEAETDRVVDDALRM